MTIALSPKIHRIIFISGLILLVIGLGWGAFPLSLSQMIIAGNWLWEGNFKWKFEKMKSSGIFWGLAAFYFFHLAGLAWSDNYAYGFKDIRIKFPLLLLPMIFVSTEALTVKEWKLVLKCFVISIIATTGWSMLFYFDLLHLKSGSNRELSRFDSHIRLSLKIVFSICVSAWFITQHIPRLQKLIWLSAIAWLIIFLFILSSLNGIVILALLLLIYLFIIMFRMEKSILKFSFILLFAGGIVYIFFSAKQSYDDFFVEREKKDEKMEIWTPTRDLYYNEKNNLSRENGYFVWRYIAYNEIKRGWNRISALKFDSADSKGNPIKYTVIRYITSLGLRKDSLAFNKLTRQDITNIENGIPNYKLAGSSHFKRRLYEIFWEVDDYFKNGALRGHSVMMRFEYWKTAGSIIKKNFIAGVGTGDIQDAFNRQYEENRSNLKSEQDRRRAHNQFIEIFAQLGIIGLVLFLLSLLLPLFQIKNMHSLYLPFFLIFIFSLVAEDTIETQMGASFYAFFNAFFIFLVRKDQEE